MKALELLSPAKNLECGIAAIDHGADAVYIGAPRFGARSQAGNSVEDIAALCRYAHRYGVRVYVTVNTIVYDDELNDTYDLLCQLSEARVDAVLLQDMGVLRMLSARPLPHQLHFHASTQTDNRKPNKVGWLRSVGFSRVVLARELSLDEISEIHRSVPDVELEVFVHGALCVSYSGLCYASQYCFGRSANRGECAQFCRMKFDLVDADGRELEHQRHLLSLKDLCQIDYLEALAESGTTSFKIEGRLKDVPYVKNVTAAYSRQLDALVKRHPDKYMRSSRGKCTYTFQPDLSKTFNRGYTNYFLNGRQNNIASLDTPKATGEYVGVVKEIQRGFSLTVAGLSSFANGDGLCFFNANRELEGFRVNRVEGNRLYPQQMPSSLRLGMRLYRNSDQTFERLLSRSSAERKIPVTMSLAPTSDGFALTIDHVTFAMPMEHQLAEKPQRDNIIRQLTRMGNTPYVCHDVDMPEDFNYFIPSSQLVELRRRALLFYEQRTSHETDSVSSDESVREQLAVPEYPRAYQYNISNQEARLFYAEHGLHVTSDAYELKADANGPLMQCRHCLRYMLGHCVKRGGQPSTWHEPLSLRLSDGRLFPLEFDCVHCQMNVYSASGQKKR